MTYKVFHPDKSTPLHPILISIPHAGTGFPPEIKQCIKPQFRDFPEDTDWFVDQIFKFANKVGITVIEAQISRYVVDLNRSVEETPLYGDGRNETGVIPTHSFSGESIYIKHDTIHKDEKKNRIKSYYEPYYKKINDLIESFRKNHKNVLFIDAHSIKRMVPSIQKSPFPDITLSDRDSSSASPLLVKALLTQLKKNDLDVSYNIPFKGGHLTKYFGQPQKRVHAIQLEISQDLYLKDITPPCLDISNTQRLSAMLQHNIEHIIPLLGDL